MTHPPVAVRRAQEVAQPARVRAMCSRLVRALCAAVLLVAAAGACKKAAAPTPDCSNYKRDGNETDVDCGGTICGPGGTGESWRIAHDCLSELCDTYGLG